MIHPNVRSVVDGDVEFISQRMRLADIIEVKALGSDPLASLRNGVAYSTVCNTLLDTDLQPIAIAGACRIPETNGATVWMLGTDGIERMKMPFLRASREYVQYLYDETGADLLFNATHAENKVHHRWLRWLGFKFIRKVELPPFNQPYIEFARLKEPYV